VYKIICFHFQLFFVQNVYAKRSESKINLIILNILEMNMLGSDAPVAVDAG
jgi:hypothetical protein